MPTVTDITTWEVDVISRGDQIMTDVFNVKVCSTKARKSETCVDIFPRKISVASFFRTSSRNVLFSELESTKKCNSAKLGLLPTSLHYSECLNILIH